MRKLIWLVTAILMAGCSGGGGSNDDPAPSPTWSISINTTQSGDTLNPALLGQYELSGVLYDYSSVTGLASAMDGVGFAEWRIGSGRWEQGTELLETLTDATDCPFTAGLFSSLTTDAALMAARDWFTYTDGSVITLADTNDNGRYDLSYIRSVIDAAISFGATPYLSIDHMPRALAINQAANRTDCGTTFMNAVSNNQPQDTTVFANAVVGLVRRVVEGSGGQGPRNVIHWEVWNEPEFLFFWHPDFLGNPDPFFNMAVPVLVSLDAYRTNSGQSQLKFGLASFAFESTAIATLSAFDAVLPNPIPMDFISFHGYDDDPLVIVDKIEQVVEAAQNSTNYQDIEIVLAEWGPDLGTRTGDQTYAATMGPPLHAATVIAMGAAAGLDRAHHALFYDYHASIALGLIDNTRQPRTLYRGYEMLAKVILPGAVRLSPAGMEDGKLDAGRGAILASRDGGGTVRVLLVNRNSAERKVTVELDGVATTPTMLYAFDASDDPHDPLRSMTPGGSEVTLPANSLMVVEF